jgi:hypothetical protein
LNAGVVTPIDYRFSFLDLLHILIR